MSIINAPLPRASFSFLRHDGVLTVDAVRTGAENMALDEEYIRAMLETEAPPHLRLYAWRPFAVSLGKHQKESDIDLDECAARGFDVVRRPTGGRAVLHARELTYSLHVRLDGGVNPHLVYEEVHHWLMAGLRHLGAEEGMEFARQQPNFRENYKYVRSAACFASSARHELLWNGKKVVGSAQKITGSVLLQHGSVLLGGGHEQITEVLKCTAEEREELREYLQHSSVTLQQITGKLYDFGEAAAAFVGAV